MSADDVIQAALAYVSDHESAPLAALRTLTELGYCCEGAAMYGPHRCTCWTAEYDVDQTEPDTSSLSGARADPCADCAYRPDSPERNESEHHAMSAPGDLERLVETGHPFWCHVGMRKPVAYVHPAGIRVEARHDHYDPPIIDGIPYLADGTAGELCHGWLARRLRFMQTETDE